MKRSFIPEFKRESAQSLLDQNYSIMEAAKAMNDSEKNRKYTRQCPSIK